MDTSTLSKQGLMDIAKSLRLRNYACKNKTDIKKMIDEYHKLHGGEKIPQKQQIILKELVYDSDTEDDDYVVEKPKPVKHVEKTEHVSKKEYGTNELKQILQILSDIQHELKSQKKKLVNMDDKVNGLIQEYESSSEEEYVPRRKSKKKVIYTSKEVKQLEPSEHVQISQPKHPFSWVGSHH